VPAVEDSPGRAARLEALGIDPTRVDSREIKPGETFHLQDRRFGDNVGPAMVAGEYMPGTTAPRYTAEDGSVHVLIPGFTVYRRKATPAKATPRAATLRRPAGLSDEDWDAYRQWLADNPGKSATQWRAMRRKAEQGKRLREMDRLTDEAQDAARRAVEPFRTSTEKEVIEAGLAPFGAGDLLRIADFLNIDFPRGVRAAPAMRLHIAQSLSQHNRRTRGGI
jgi:hypothetical protein